ncbi:hypothetical protein PR002_g22335, partial [Phytophthora rubi]
MVVERALSSQEGSGDESVCANAVAELVAAEVKLLADAQQVVRTGKQELAQLAVQRLREETTTTEQTPPADAAAAARCLQSGEVADAVAADIDRAADEVVRAVSVQRVEAAEMGIVQFTDDDIRREQQQSVMKEQARQAMYYNQRNVRSRSDYRAGQLVWMYRPARGPKITKFGHKWIGPGQVIEQAGYDNYRTKMLESGHELVTHCSFLVPYYYPTNLLEQMAKDIAIDLHEEAVAAGDAEADLEGEGGAGIAGEGEGAAGVTPRVVRPLQNAAPTPQPRHPETKQPHRAPNVAPRSAEQQPTTTRRHSNHQVALVMLPNQPKAALAEAKQTTTEARRSPALTLTPTGSKQDKTAPTAPQQAAGEAVSATPLLEAGAAIQTPDHDSSADASAPEPRVPKTPLPAGRVPESDELHTQGRVLPTGTEETAVPVEHGEQRVVQGGGSEDGEDLCDGEDEGSEDTARTAARTARTAAWTIADGG